MKVLVATKEGQGGRKNNFSWTEDGEFVGFTFECDGERIDGSCGCRRSFAGLHSHKATTTATVKESAITPEEFMTIHRKSMEEGGWVKPDSTDAGWVADDAKELLRLASVFPVGAIIEKRGNSIQTRIKKGGTK